MNIDRPQELLFSGSEHPSDELISTYLDDEATEGERVAISGHLPDCGDCTTRLEQQREIAMLLKALPAVTAPRSFALRAEPPNPAQSWFHWMRLGAAFASFAFVALLTFNIAYVGTDAGRMSLEVREQAVQLESEAMSSSAEAPALTEAESAPRAKMSPEVREQAVQLESEAMSSSEEAPASTDAESAPAAKRAIEAKEAAAQGEPAAAGMAAAKVGATGPPASPVAGYEWPMLAVAIVLSFSALGIWLLRIRR